MNRKISAFIILFSTVLLLSSCLKDDEDTTTYYHDTAITSFSVGTLKSLDKTTSSGAAASVNCSSYKFYIDQANHLIYNVDSLPYHVDASKVVASISTKNSGVLGLKSLTSDSILYYSGTDSVDFTKPRTFYVYASDYSAYSTYQIKVNVHQQEGNEFKWQEMGTVSEFTSLNTMKTVVNGTKIYMFGTVGNRLHIYSSSTEDGAKWQEIETTLPASVAQNVVVYDGNLYTLNGNQLIKSEDAKNWQTVSEVTLDRLVAAGTLRLFGVSAGKLMQSRDGGKSWEVDAQSGEADLPENYTGYAAVVALTNDSTETVMVVGTKDSVVVWNKISEYSQNSENQEWSKINAQFLYDKGNSRLKVSEYPKQMIITRYADGAIGLASDGYFYYTENGGLHWLRSSSVEAPVQIQSVAALTKDEKNFLWLVDGTTGKVWKGRHNNQGWAIKN